MLRQGSNGSWSRPCGYPHGAPSRYVVASASDHGLTPEQN